MSSINGSGISPQIFSDAANVVKDSISVVADQLGGQSNGQSSLGSSNSSPSLGCSSDSLSSPGLGSSGNNGTIQSDLARIMNGVQNLVADVDGDNQGPNANLGNGQGTSQASNLQSLEREVGLNFLSQGLNNHNSQDLSAGFNLIEASLSDGSDSSGGLGGSGTNTQQILSTILEALQASGNNGLGAGLGTMNAPGGDPQSSAPLTYNYQSSSGDTGGSLGG